METDNIKFFEKKLKLVYTSKFIKIITSTENLKKLIKSFFNNKLIEVLATLLVARAGKIHGSAHAVRNGD